MNSFNVALLNVTASSFWNRFKPQDDIFSRDDDHTGNSFNFINLCLYIYIIEPRHVMTNNVAF